MMIVAMVTAMTIVARVLVASKAINVRAILVEELQNSDACTLHCVVRGNAMRGACAEHMPILQNAHYNQGDRCELACRSLVVGQMELA